MKSSILISAGLLFSIPGTLAAPAPKFRQPRAIALASKPANGTVKAKNKLEFYSIMLESNETRSWNDFFGDMGYNHTDLEEMKHTLDFRSFGCEKTFRSFGMMMTAEEVEDMGNIEGVALVQKPFVYTSPEMPPWDETDVVIHDFLAPQNVSLHGRQLNQQVPLGQPKKQTNTVWGLQRISSSQPVRPVGKGPKEFGYQYTYSSQEGSGVDVYVLDGGLNQHQEFGQRGKRLWSYWAKDENDDTGHGTHCAGTIGGLYVGAAKNANIWGVKILKKGASYGDSLTNGIEEVLASHVKRRTDPEFRGSVINLSVGKMGPDPFQRAVLQRASKAGVHIVVAASNYGTDACKYTPAMYARELPIISVGAMDIRDQRRPDSNFGPCVTIFAPGTDIMSANSRDPKGYIPKSGTSMAAPLVAGMVADLLSKKPEFKENPQGLKNYLVQTGFPNVVKDARGPAPLANNGFQN
ncbi:hypothetical protein H072_3820 [Dactylellina haptotyla CBS 200.50]|uniref:Peptidase S8/S53 domain-containing protein n=1 Tax=Dactylellina haptotyla (strain CBS 200.50) TaxID=1284197 RepID=S8BRS4_DACHA|nr:hypothetical protein H072_3820 [Dactylellina haptotyla CBS 200.50]